MRPTKAHREFTHVSGEFRVLLLQALVTQNCKFRPWVYVCEVVAALIVSYGWQRQYHQKEKIDHLDGPRKKFQNSF